MRACGPDEVWWWLSDHYASALDEPSLAGVVDVAGRDQNATRYEITPFESGWQPDSSGRPLSSLLPGEFDQSFRFVMHLREVGD